MTGPSAWQPDPADATGSLLRRAYLENRRATRAAGIASRHEASARRGLPDDELHARLAAIHRLSEKRHLVMQELYESLAARKEAAIPATPLLGLPASELLAVAAHLAGSTGAIIALVDARETEAMFFASDPLAGQAHDLEYEVGEGPGCEVVRTRQPVMAADRELSARWSAYGPAVAGLDVRAVAAVPLESGSTCLGALTLLNPPASASATMGVLGEALVGSLLDDPAFSGPNRLLASAGTQMDVQQAAGMISVRHGCSVADALAMIRARAFADGTSTAVVADGILRRRQDL